MNIKHEGVRKRKTHREGDRKGREERRWEGRNDRGSPSEHLSQGLGNYFAKFRFH